MKLNLLIIVLLLSNSLLEQIQAQEIKVEFVNFDNHFKSFGGSFVLLDIDDNKMSIYNDSISTKRYSPCSTFKITNSLIGLESGIAENTDYLIKYDSLKNPSEPWMNNVEPFKHWHQDHNLQTAIKYSVVWYYQELARRIGNENMTKLLNQIDYGNNDISSGIDNFWLCGSLKISAKEQVEFLRKLYENSLSGFSIKNQEMVKNILLYESNDNYKLYGKTGGGNCLDNKTIGWYVGFVESDNKTYVFAMNIFANGFSDFKNNMRINLAKDLLKELKIIK